MKKFYSDIEIIASINKGGNHINDVMNYLYHFSGIKETVMIFVNSQGGNTMDGEDIFHDSLTNAILNIQKGRFNENSSVKTYILAISKNLWFNKFKREIKFKEIKQNVNSDVKTDIDPEVLFIENQNSNLLKNVLNEIGEICKKVLGLWSLNYSFKEIGKELGKSEGAVRKQKFDCMKKLTLFFRNNPKFINELGF